MWRAARKKNFKKTPQSCGVGGTCGEHFVEVPEQSRRSDVIRKIAQQEAYTIICATRRDAGETETIRTVDQNESQIQVRCVAGVRNNGAECFVETAEGVSRAREVRKVTTRGQVGQRSNQQRDRSPAEKRGRQLDCGQYRLTQCHHHRELECRGRESREQTSKGLLDKSSHLFFDTW